MSFDEFHQSYDDQINQAIAFGGQEHEFYLKVKADVLIELLSSQHQKAPVELLDVGCGNGTMHPFLLSSPLPIQVTGIEVASQFVAVARENNPAAKYETYDGTRLPYVSGSFDAAVAICVMHHVPRAGWALFIDELSRVVKPGGLVAVFEHNPFNPLTLYVVKTCPIDRDAVLLRPGRLVGLMRDAGLAAIAHEFILFTPFKSAACRRFERLMAWLPLGAQYVVFARVPPR